MPSSRHRAARLCYQSGVRDGSGRGAQARLTRSLLENYADRLSRERVAEATELLLNHEPNEALLGIVWDLAARKLAIPQRDVESIKQTIADVRDLPPGFGDA
jgi:hypothetical protein